MLDLFLTSLVYILIATFFVLLIYFVRKNIKVSAKIIHIQSVT